MFDKLQLHRGYKIPKGSAVMKVDLESFEINSEVEIYGKDVILGMDWYFIGEPLKVSKEKYKGLKDNQFYRRWVNASKLKNIKEYK